MLRGIALTAQGFILALVVYTLVTAIPGWRTPIVTPPGRRTARFRVLIPAHNEEGVIGGVIDDLDAQDYRSDQKGLWVLVDRSQDRTADIAGARGANIALRNEGPPGKGAAISWYLREHPLEPDETLVVLDADNRVGPNFLARLADELEAGHQALQVYIDSPDPGSSWIARAGAMSYWAGNRMVQLARSNLGWSADLGGTGMAITARALEAAGGFGDSITEDQELGIRLALAGIEVHWVHDVRIADEKPRQASVALRQRARWMAGRRSVARRYTGPLLREAIRRRRWSYVDQAIRLVQPGRSFVALLTALLAVIAAVVPSVWLLPWWVWAGAALSQLIAPVFFLSRDGVRGRQLAWYPALILLGALRIPVALVSRRVSGWYHTPHGH